MKRKQQVPLEMSYIGSPWNSAEVEPDSLICTKLLRAILHESETKLEMKNFNPSSIFVCR